MITFEDLKDDMLNDIDDWDQSWQRTYARWRKEHDHAVERKEKEMPIVNERIKVYFSGNVVILAVGEGKDRNTWQSNLPKPAEKDKFGAFCHALAETYLVASSVEAPSKCPMISIIDILRDGLKTVVRFNDGTTECCEAPDEAAYEPQYGVDICIMKKVLGSTGEIMKALKMAEYNANKRYYDRKEEQRLLKADKEIEAKYRQKWMERKYRDMVEEEMMRIRARREAERRIAAQDARRKDIPQE